MKRSNLKLLKFSIYSLYTLLLLIFGYKLFLLFDNTYYQYFISVAIGSLFFLLLQLPKMVFSLLMRNYMPVKRRHVRRG